MTESIRFDGADGLTLVADAVSGSDAPPVLFLHGGGQTRRSWKRSLSVVASLGWRSYPLCDGPAGHLGRTASGRPRGVRFPPRCRAGFFGRAALLGISFLDASAVRGVASVFQKAGIRLVALPDRAGMLVLRTLAQLANAAADAFDDSVASAEDIGLAMRHGANHPESPLEWVARFGSERLIATLQAIAAETQDRIYRPSVSLRSNKRTST